MELGKYKNRFKCGDVVLRIDTGRCGMCGDSIPTGSILRVMSDEDVMWYEIDHLPAKAKVEEFSDAVRVSMNGNAIATILTDIATPLGTLHFESWAREIAQSMANIINLQISLGKLTSDGIKVEKTNDKER